MHRTPSRRALFAALLVLAAVVVGCGPGGVCESDDERREREARERQMFTSFIASTTPPTVSRIESKLTTPVTTYTVTAHGSGAFGGGDVPLTYEWSMKGEACGTPKVEWQQSGASVKWSHSDQAPDSCKHTGTNHAVVATVIVKTTAGYGRKCSIEGSEDRVIDNPQCEEIRPAAPSPSGTPAR